MKARVGKFVSAVFNWLKRELYWMVLPWLLLGALWSSGAFFRAFDAPLTVAVIAVFSLWMLLLSSVFFRRATLAVVWLELATVAAFCRITPEQRFRDTVWQKPWSRTLEAKRLADGRYELRNVRDFHYRSEHDFDVDYRTVIVDPEQISSIDAVFSHWDNLEGIAHSMLGLNFADGTTVVISLETRLPEGVEQNGLDGFYRRYGLAMIAGTPEDLYGLRVDHRGETLYVYRLRANHEYMRRLTLSLFERAEELRKKPEYYNSLFRNCTTGLLPLLPDADKTPANDIRLLLNGMADNMLFEQSLIVCRKDESFGSLRSRSLVPGLCRGKNAPPERYRGESEARWVRDR